ncbi:hypothetical protein AB7714_06200 [Tardiphaga sp. 1201_B9_N1_1]|uniref:hypothetical protein n=1 Tax=unclassified Tardiphaga TaxID=2631404 RepID=UPI003F2632D7
MPTSFRSAKTPKPISVGSDQFRDALIRATLDPAVRSIEPIVEIGPIDDLALVVRDDGRFAYGVTRPHAPQCVGAGLLNDLPISWIILTDPDIYREPAITNERIVWSHRRRRLSNGLRIQVLRMLACDGPVPIAELISRLRIPARSMAAIFSMACADQVELHDIAVRPLGPHSLVGGRSAPRAMMGAAAYAAEPTA